MLSASRILITFFAVLASLFFLASALPVNLQRRDIWDPKVLYPHELTIWKVGNKYDVVWDLSQKPAEVTNFIGEIYLRKDGETIPSGPGSQFEPLASGFNLTIGHIEITVPNVEPGWDYQLVLMGDSGNFSPQFIIVSEDD
ncbi:hypothetical protein M0805_003350 [Coniferiporia weirii]|nr:hypothetical protein M0805_003350 [Coniferiporia weirii]